MRKELESLRPLGFTETLAIQVGEGIEIEELARVVAQHKDRYTIISQEGFSSAEITGNLRFSANESADFPAVGDWVKIMKMDDEHAIILEILPRFSKLERQAVGKYGETQLIATNINTAFIVQSVGHDFNLNRFERYLAICNSAGIRPVILLTKIDTVSEREIQNLLDLIHKRLPNVPALALSAITDPSMIELHQYLKKNETHCFIGSSGVGKSTIINALKGEDFFRTQAISDKTSKGKHTTTHRELIILNNGSIVVDTPGMREIGMINDATGIELTYDVISDLAKECLFANCKHEQEKGCAVIEAVENGSLSVDAYENFMKLKREQERFSASKREKRQKDKAQGKLYKSIMNEKKKRRF